MMAKEDINSANGLECDEVGMSDAEHMLLSRIVSPSEMTYFEKSWKELGVTIISNWYVVDAC